MQTPGIEADILQQPIRSSNGKLNIILNVDLEVDCSLLQQDSILFL